MKKKMNLMESASINKEEMNMLKGGWCGTPYPRPFPIPIPIDPWIIPINPVNIGKPVVGI